MIFPDGENVGYWSIWVFTLLIMQYGPSDKEWPPSHPRPSHSNSLMDMDTSMVDTSLQYLWPCHIIDNQSTGADGVKYMDINDDGRVDLVTGWEEGGVTKVYFHPGSDKVKEPWPAVTIGVTPDVEDAFFVDFNSDGQTDVVTLTEGKTKTIWVHQASKKHFQDPKGWQQKIIPITKLKQQWMYGLAMQVDGEFGEDLVVAGKNKQAAIGWLQAPKRKRKLADWRWYPIGRVGWVMSILSEDMDNDGDLDLLITDRRGPLQGCRWLENPGLGMSLYQNWKNHNIGGEQLEVMFMDYKDLNGDGVSEVMVCERTTQTIRIYSRSSAGLKAKWIERIIPIPSFTGSAKSVAIGDLNGDQIPDLVLSTNTMGEEKVGLTWINGEHLENTTSSAFQPISRKHHAKYDQVQLLDMDEDGDLDVLICEENYGAQSQGLGVVWYENTIIY